MTEDNQESGPGNVVDFNQNEEAGEARPAREKPRYPIEKSDLSGDLDADLAAAEKRMEELGIQPDALSKDHGLTEAHPKEDGDLGGDVIDASDRFRPDPADTQK